MELSCSGAAKGGPLAIITGSALTAASSTSPVTTEAGANGGVTTSACVGGVGGVCAGKGDCAGGAQGVGKTTSALNRPHAPGPENLLPYDASVLLGLRIDDDDVASDDATVVGVISLPPWVRWNSDTLGVTLDCRMVEVDAAATVGEL